MRPAWSVLLLTTLIGAGQGLFLALIATETLGRGGPTLFVPGSVLALGLLAGGVYMTPSHPGFTSAAHTEEDVQHVLEVSERVLRQIEAAT